MDAKITVENPDSIEMTLTLTMPLAHWKKLRDQLPQNWPAWDVGSKITSMVNQAEKHFYPEAAK